MNKIYSIYTNLFSSFGPQLWWPVTPQGKLQPDYSGGPKNEKQQLEVCFGAILTQNTNWKNVEKAIVELNKNNLINIDKISKIKKQKLAEIIKSSGYHNQKAMKLKNFCDFLLKRYNGNLKELFCLDILELRKELLSVNGIGPETADSIILYSAKKPIFVVDAYTKRIFQRLGFKEQSYGGLQQLFMKSLENSEKLFNEYHALLVELGKNVCRKQPLCYKCPLKGCCSHYKKEALNN
ncbi:endonuclease III domain-containing protein [Candidatus Woesearchaeota archaeon]|nr:endonuclease III domain-containing protein [Candidatus Woesearchaeota archaeon]